MGCRAAATLTEAERFAEIAELLARGVQRFLVAEIKATAKPRNSRDPLDDDGEHEAPCGPRATRPRSKTA